MEDIIFGVSISIISLYTCIVVANRAARIPYFSFLDERRNRAGSIDGLRGYLALLVFFHHFVVTYYWKSLQVWERPPEDLYQNFGKVGVAIFFMITGFLFFTKINNSRGSLNWLALYSSRFFRIVPLYLAAFFIVLIFVFEATGYELHTSIGQLFKDLTKWGLFIGGFINDFGDTKRIIAGVDWTLKYEWLFYLLLPIIALTVRYTGNVGLVVLALLALAGYLNPVTIPYFTSKYLILFAAGGTISILIRQIPQTNNRERLSSVTLLILIVAALIYPNTFDLVHTVIMSVLFYSVARGNSLFGMLTSRASILLGEISYSIYLLHGVVLYVLFTKTTVVDVSRFSLSEFFYFMPLVSVLVVIISMVTYLTIEKPCMEFGKDYFAALSKRGADKKGSNSYGK
ncbi:MAG TPA: hypothetical protein DEP33_13810 [Alteromonas sp.]|jgi:peptidoglycan/LPS O-acetylase OafA/YrhL|nr:hypothetical protein [Alteromonas sp.]HCL12512.1 hypothetical protein [Alteromonas sp.]|tara:strand:- start:10755 stop:11954 length:1200 start_codon:yes stop_codon:yes gene_type:complete